MEYNITTLTTKEENDNYNLIIENINKLVDICGNTKEAIELRDNLFNLFTTKYSEPLYEVLGLQEEIGCSLEEIFEFVKLLRKYYFVDIVGRLQPKPLLNIRENEKRHF